jgi:hypothetical protein
VALFELIRDDRELRGMLVVVRVMRGVQDFLSTLTVVLALAGNRDAIEAARELLGAEWVAGVGEGK